MTRLSGRERGSITAGTVMFFVGAVLAGALHASEALPRWAGWTLAAVAVAGLTLLVGTTVRALLRGDTEGVEHHDAARASLAAVLVVVVAGFAYSLLEAFAGLPRMTAAVPAAVAALVWVIAFTWRHWAGEER